MTRQYVGVVTGADVITIRLFTARHIQGVPCVGTSPWVFLAYCQQRQRRPKTLRSRPYARPLPERPVTWSTTTLLCPARALERSADGSPHERRHGDSLAPGNSLCKGDSPSRGLGADRQQVAGSARVQECAGVLTAKGRIDESTFSKLQCCSWDHDRSIEISDALKELRDKSALYMTDDELQRLETWARRMRGEVFFAEKWMIVEGPADYLIVEALAQALDYDLDEHGVTLIDAKNSGDPVHLAALARALRIPWIAVFDGDTGGTDVLKRMRKRGFDPLELRRRYRMHAAGDLEQQLVRGLGQEVRPLAEACRVDPNLEGRSLAKSFHRTQPRLSALLAERVRDDRSFTQYLPEAFRTAIKDLRELT